MPLNLARIAIAITISFTGLLASIQYSYGQTTSAPPATIEQSEAAEPNAAADSETPASPEQTAEQTTTSDSPEAESQQNSSVAEGADSHGSEVHIKNHVTAIIM